MDHDLFDMTTSSSSDNMGATSSTRSSSTSATANKTPVMTLHHLDLIECRTLKQLAAKLSAEVEQQANEDNNNNNNNTNKSSTAYSVCMNMNGKATFMSREETLSVCRDIFEGCLPQLSPLRSLRIGFGLDPFRDSFPLDILGSLIQRTRHTLRILKMSHLVLKDDGMDQLISAFTQHPSLKTIALSHVRPHEDNQQYNSLLGFLQALASCPKLNKIEMEEVELVADHFLMWEERQQQAQQALVSLVSTTNNLSTLTLTNLPRLGPSMVMPLFEALETNTSLQHLSLASSKSEDYGTHGGGRRYCRPLNEQAVQAISNVLRVNTTLQSLTLYCSVYMLAPIAQALTENQSLKHLRVSTWPRGSPPRPDVQTAFCEMLQYNNTTLHHLDGYMGQWMDPPELQLYLKLNRIGRRHLLEHGTLEEWVHVLHTHQDDTRVIYYLLHKKPSLIR